MSNTLLILGRAVVANLNAPTPSRRRFAGYSETELTAFERLGVAERVVPCPHPRLALPSRRTLAAE